MIEKGFFAPLLVLAMVAAAPSPAAGWWPFGDRGGARCGTADGLPVYDFRVVRELPHDPDAFTQGLLVSGPWLFESTGLYGASSLRMLKAETGQEVMRQALPAELFGEGLAEADGRLYQLTWREGRVRIYDPADLALLREAEIPEEGWGLTFDGSRLVHSDGSALLRLRDPADLREVGRLRVTAAGAEVDGLNELEYADGRILANVFLTTCIAVIEPADGRVTGWLDIGELERRVRAESDAADVANGIAYRAATGTYYVTGKRWPRLFELQVNFPDRAADRR